MAGVGRYRIRWANVSYGNGYRLTRERMCIAERRHLGFFWFPLFGGEWRPTYMLARLDIENDKRLREPLPSPSILDA